MRKKTTEEFKKQIQDINSNIEILGEYQGNKIKISCKCKIYSHEWEARPDNLLHWGCPKCRLVQQARDLFVEKYCIVNNINLVTIPYTLSDQQAINICKQILK